MTPVADYQLLNSSLTIAVSLFVLGGVGVMVRRNLAVMCFSAAIMLQGVCLAFCSFGSFHADWAGRTSGWIAIAVASVIGLLLAAVGSALVLRFRTLQTSSTVVSTVLQPIGDESIELRADPPVPRDAEFSVTLTNSAARDE